MTLDEIRQLIQLVSETGIAELEVQRGDQKVRIRLGAADATREQVHIAPAHPELARSPGAVATVSPRPPRDEPPAQDNLLYVRSPIVGTFYEASSPGSPPFVNVGDAVEPGKVLCIIESMKLMNEIEAEAAGVIESKLVSNGQPVEYGEALFAIRPV